MKSGVDLDHLAVRMSHSPVQITASELRAGRRWTLLQSIAWIATGVQSFVDLVQSWTPLDVEYPLPGSAQAASLEMAKQLRGLLPPAISFQLAQLHLFRLLKAGGVVIYVVHTEHIPVGADFTGISYNADFTGLLPPQDKRPWDYITVDVETLKVAWAADPASQHVATGTQKNLPSVGSGGPPFTSASSWAEISAWYTNRVKAAPKGGYTREEDQAAAKHVGISRGRWRDLRRELAPDVWSKDGPKLGRKTN